MNLTASFFEVKEDDDDRLLILDALDDYWLQLLYAHNKI